MSVISFIWGILQFTVGVLTLITGTVALDSMTLRYKISCANCIFKMDLWIKRIKCPQFQLIKGINMEKMRQKMNRVLKDLKITKVLWSDSKGYFEGTPQCTSLGLMLLITGTVGKRFMTQRLDSDTIFRPFWRNPISLSDPSPIIVLSTVVNHYKPSYFSYLMDWMSLLLLLNIIR